MSIITKTEIIHTSTFLCKKCHKVSHISSEVEVKYYEKGEKPMKEDRVFLHRFNRDFQEREIKEKGFLCKECSKISEELPVANYDLKFLTRGEIVSKIKKVQYLKWIFLDPISEPDILWLKELKYKYKILGVNHISILVSPISK